MAYPTFLARIVNYLQAANAGQPFPNASLDGEMDNTVAVVNAINSWMRGVTDSDGRLINLAAATAQALAGAQRFVATASQTAFVTTITYDSAFTNLNVEVVSNGVVIDPNLVTPANATGFLQVTIPAQPVGAVVVVMAYSSGAGLLTRLQSTANSQGASLVGIEDSGALYVSTNSETAFAEVMTKLNLLITNIGTISNYLKKDGSVAMTGALAMGAQKITGLADGTNNTDAVTVEQLVSATASLTDLYTQFVKVDGTIPMSGSLAMGGNKITGMANGVASTDAATVGQISNANSPAGVIVAYGGISAPSGWVLCDGSTYDGTNATYAALYAAIQNRFGGSGASAFKVPDHRGLTSVGAGSSQTYTDAISSTSKTTTARNINDKFGEETHMLIVDELAAHTHKVANGNGATLSTIAASNSVAGYINGFSSYELGTVQQIIANTGLNTPHNNIQPTIALTYIIKL